MCEAILLFSFQFYQVIILVDSRTKFALNSFIFRVVHVYLSINNYTCLLIKILFHLFFSLLFYTLHRHSICGS